MTALALGTTGPTRPGFACVPWRFRLPVGTPVVFPFRLPIPTSATAAPWPRAATNLTISRTAREPVVSGARLATRPSQGELAHSASMGSGHLAKVEGSNPFSRSIRQRRA
jgi:hypothetical protein